jgi:hypothetical protein
MGSGLHSYPTRQEHGPTPTVMYDLPLSRSPGHLQAPIRYCVSVDWTGLCAGRGVRRLFGGRLLYASPTNERFAQYMIALRGPSSQTVGLPHSSLEWLFLCQPYLSLLQLLLVNRYATLLYTPLLRPLGRSHWCRCPTMQRDSPM